MKRKALLAENRRLREQNLKLLYLPRDPADCYRCERLLARNNEVLRGASRTLARVAELEATVRGLLGDDCKPATHMWDGEGLCPNCRTIITKRGES